MKTAQEKPNDYFKNLKKILLINDNKILIKSILGLIILVVIAVKVLISMSTQNVENQYHRQLQSVVNLKKEHIETWLAGHEKDMQFLRTAKPFLDWLKNPQTEKRENFKERIKSLKNSMLLSRLYILTKQGDFVIQEDREVLSPELKQTIKIAFDSGKIETTGLYKDKEGNIYLDLVAKFKTNDDFMIVMKIDQKEFLFPFLQKWPIQSDTAETLLFKKIDTGVIFLNELRHQPSTALKHQIPFQEETVLAIQVANKSKILPDELLIGTDYRGTEVIGVGVDIPKTEWTLIAKIDRSEIKHDIRQEVIFSLLILLLLIFSLITGYILIRQQRQLKDYYKMELEQAENSLDLVFEVIPDLYFRMTLEGVILDYKAHSSDDLYTSPEFFLGKKMQDVLPSQLGILFQEKINTVKSTGLLEQYEYEMDIGGESKWYESRLSLVKEKKQIIAVIRDISQNKAYEKELKIASVVIENSPAVLFRWKATEKWPVESVSKNVKQFGYKAEDLLSGKVEYADIVHKDDLDRIAKEVAYFSDSGAEEFRQEYRIVSPSGDIFWTDDFTHIERDKNGDVIYYQGFVIDITEKYFADKKIQQLARAVEQSSESIIITNLNAEIEYVNDAFQKNSGYNFDDVLGKNPRFLQSGQTSNETHISLWNALTSGKDWKGKFYNRRKDGTEFTEFATISSIHQKDGAITHYVSVQEDVTEKEQVANELDDYRNKLEHLVEIRTEELNVALVKADEASQAKSEFLANMSHEIRTPMNAILGLVHLLKRSEVNEQQRQQLIKINSSASHLLSILNDILDISKIEAGKLQLENSEFHLKTIFDHLTSIMKTQAEEKNLIFQVDMDHVPHWLKGDVTRIRQALLNYLSNAVKFSQDGVIKISSDLLKKTDDKVLIKFKVTDQGIGIAEDKLIDVFGAFAQADSSTTREFGGTGLGLAISKKIAELMGGEIGVESELGKGSAFWFSAWITVLDEKPIAVKAATNGKLERKLRQEFNGATILIVEDNDINREVAGELLKIVNLNVDMAVNGIEGLEKIKLKHYDAVLMDVQMPEMSGLEATRLIRKMHDREALQIIAMTANAFDEDRNACLQAGMNDFVAKPVNPESLYLIIYKSLKNNQVLSNPSQVLDKELIRQYEEPIVIKDDDLLAYLKTIKGLNLKKGLINVANKENVLFRLLNKFDDQQTDFILEMSTSLKKNDFKSSIEKVHTLKGSAGNIGLEDIYSLSKNIELLLREESEQNGFISDTIKDVFHTELVTILNRFQKQLATIVIKKSSIEDELSREGAIRLLESLISLLVKDDTTVNNIFYEKRRLLEKALSADMAELGKTIENYDYPDAVQLIESFLNTI